MFRPARAEHDSQSDESRSFVAMPGFSRVGSGFGSGTLYRLRKSGRLSSEREFARKNPSWSFVFIGGIFACSARKRSTIPNLLAAGFDGPVFTQTRILHSFRVHRFDPKTKASPWLESAALSAAESIVGQIRFTTLAGRPFIADGFRVGQVGPRIVRKRRPESGTRFPVWATLRNYRAELRWQMP